jgi:hypothetical protein
MAEASEGPSRRKVISTPTQIRGAARWIRAPRRGPRRPLDCRPDLSLGALRKAAAGRLVVTFSHRVRDAQGQLTYQAGLLEKAGLITRGPSPDDERTTLVTITENG